MSKKIMRLLFAAIILAVAFVATKAIAEPIKKVLLVVSNKVDMGDPEKHDARNNLWEVASPYHIFISHGFEVDFLSPKGEEVKFVMDPIGISSYSIKYENFLEKTSNSLFPDEIDPNNYWGVFIGGGYGVMFDVADNKKNHLIISSVCESGGIIGVVGHGSAGIANVALSDGKFLVKDKKGSWIP